MPSLGRIRRALSTFLVLASISVWAHASSATLLLEEPYGKLGFFAATGHAAVYLSGVCAETPLKLRPCAPGELGVVISRYDGVSGYDWVAIPLIPYLYAVDGTDEIPLFADAKLVNFLRDQYRRKHLEEAVPDLESGAAPGGNWYELVGSSYDRTVYAFEIETTEAKDAEFIEKYNAAENRSHFRTVSHNCADFAKDVINFYYPRSLHRSVVADVGITTPKQMAKTMMKYSAHHPELKFARWVIPQIPGSLARSAPVHGVVESFLKSKKYIVPSAIVSPVFAGCVVAVYVGTGAGRFDPSKQALVYNAERGLQPPLGDEDRRAFQLELNHFMASHPAAERADLWFDPFGKSGTRVEKWGRLLHDAAPELDSDGRPVLRLHEGADVVSLGVAASNILDSHAPEQLTQKVLEARLQSELRKGNAPKVSESDVEHDWNLLQQVSGPDTEVARTRSGLQPGMRGGNRP